MARIFVKSAVAAAALGFAVSATAGTAPAPVQPAAASAVDLSAIDAVMDSVYAVISGPAGQKRDFDRMRSLFAPNALLRVVTPTGLRGGTLDEFIARNGQMLEKEGFSERELGRRVEIYGNLASVWSSYDGRTASGSLHMRGINSFQLVKLGGKWLVASILWQEETPDLPVPPDMLPAAGKQ